MNSVEDLIVKVHEETELAAKRYATGDDGKFDLEAYLSFKVGVGVGLALLAEALQGLEQGTRSDQFN